MNIPPLCIIAARSKSARLPNKMLQTLGGETLFERGHRLACEAFGKENVVAAVMVNDTMMGCEAWRCAANIFDYNGDENDVLGRFHVCAHRYRWHPDSIIHRWTCDDPFKSPEACRRVAAGERLPVELGGEAFTLAMLDAANSRAQYGGRTSESNVRYLREHITNALFPTSPPPCPPGCWTIDTEQDLLAARAKLAEMEE